MSASDVETIFNILHNQPIGDALSEDLAGNAKRLLSLASAIRAKVFEVMTPGPWMDTILDFNRNLEQYLRMDANSRDLPRIAKDENDIFNDIKASSAEILNAYIAGIQCEFGPVLPPIADNDKIARDRGLYTRMVAVSDQGGSVPFDEQRVQKSVVRLLSEERKRITDGIREIESDFQKTIAEANSQFAAAVVEIRKIVNEASESVALAVAKSDTAVQQAEAGHKLANSINEQTKITELNLNSFVNEARARGNFDQLKIEWNNRANAATWAVSLSYALVLILIAAPVVYLSFSYSNVMDYLKEVGSLTKEELGENPNAGLAAVVAATRLALIGVPLVLYFWIIRLAVKFNSRSMMLMDDSRARATMLETYYRMIAKDAAKDEDRAQVLAALFRPTPGYEADSGEPPTLISSVLNLANGRGG
ncbi:hypothetical protein [Mesorhizobium sp. B2-5-3]|uniref:hypothetical protein n=1 Tax=Mesorhizobium sp. B2-5-3 TaxID=2589927 RepID=UPI001129A66F|nr:hypothetical protein [Mesorhizobium sp. B2-5-3]TPK38687.1 hypothetical protein FJ867_08765 [Mesorhizobium sp. B2-5-3]